MNYNVTQAYLREMQERFSENDPQHLALAAAMRALSDKHEGKLLWKLQNKLVIYTSNILNIAVAAMGFTVIGAVLQFCRTFRWEYAVLVFLAGIAAAILAKISEYLLNNA